MRDLRYKAAGRVAAGLILLGLVPVSSAVIDVFTADPPAAKPHVSVLRGDFR